MITRLAPRSDVPEAPAAFAEAEPFREPSVVHSAFGRLRVHLPHWAGDRGEELAAAVCFLPGVTGAEANPLTGNVLLRFEPGHTSAAALLAALPALRLDPPVNPSLLLGGANGLPAVVGQTLGPLVESQPAELAVYVTGSGRVVYRALGWSSVGMAVVGAIMPGIPTAPFVILAGYFFARSSPEAHEWLRQSRWFGPFLRDWEEHGGVRRWVRNAALGLIGGGMVVTALLGLSVPVTATILTLQAVGMAIVLRLPVIEPASPAPAAAL
jgi:uncharacterized membrane protein YbaN (DUF454 family)